MELILASQSPRRRELFELIGLSFTALVSPADENIPLTDPGSYVEALALRKAEGMVLGRKKGSFTKQKVLIDNQEEIVRMLEQDKSITDICKRFGLSRDTFAKFRRKYPAVQRALSDKEKRRVQQFRKNRL